MSRKKPYEKPKIKVIEFEVSDNIANISGEHDVVTCFSTDSYQPYGPL